MKDMNVWANICTCKEKGITLIALIITIIVMLILISVTLLIALGENGIIAKAKDLKIRMDRETEREKLVSIVEGAREDTGKIDFEKITLPEGAKWITTKGGSEKQTPNLNSGNWIITVKKIEFFITINGTVLDDETNGNSLDGTYYGYKSTEKSACFEIYGNTITILGSVNRAYTFTKNESNKTIIGDIGSDNETNSFIWEYDIITGNKIIISDYGEGYKDLFSTTEEGLTYSLKGSYINNGQTYKYIFNNATHEALGYYKSGNSWIRDLENGPYIYTGYNEKYYMNGREISSRDDFYTILIGEDTYIKISN